MQYTDSIAELIQFWDRHDLTDFEDRLEEIIEPVYIIYVLTQKVTVEKLTVERQSLVSEQVEFLAN